MKRIPPQAISGLGALVVVSSFFLPWMIGAGALEFRSFSGFDFARLVRNFEITTDSAAAAGQLRATAIAVYMAPALSANGAVLHLLAASWLSLRRVGGYAAVASAVYVIVLLVALLGLSLLHVSEFALVVGLPTYGFALTASGALLLAAGGVYELRRPPA